MPSGSRRRAACRYQRADHVEAPVRGEEHVGSVSGGQGYVHRVGQPDYLAAVSVRVSLRHGDRSTEARSDGGHLESAGGGVPLDESGRCEGRADSVPAGD